jgi:hypothetical protein
VHTHAIQDATAMPQIPAATDEGMYSMGMKRVAVRTDVVVATCEPEDELGRVSATTVYDHMHERMAYAHDRKHVPAIRSS